MSSPRLAKGGIHTGIALRRSRRSRRSSPTRPGWLADTRPKPRSAIRPILSTSSDPTWRTTPSSSTARSLACTAGEHSDTSSRKRRRLSRCAVSKTPVRWASAPVNAPFRCPNNSTSARSSGIAARDTASGSSPISAPIARTTCPLPVPRSPIRKTGTLVRAKLGIFERISVISREKPTKSVSTFLPAFPVVVSGNRFDR